MYHILNDIRPITSLEVGDIDGDNSSGSIASIRVILEQGYSVYEIEKEKLRLHNLKEYCHHVNLIFSQIQKYN